MSAVPIVISLFSVGISAVVAFHSFRASRIKSALGVLVTETRGVIGEITPSNSPMVIVRNDGQHAVTLESLRYAYGNLHVQDRAMPEMWGFAGLPHPSVLRPHEEHSTPVPSVPELPTRTRAKPVGPVAIVRDDSGRRWHVMGGDRQRIPETAVRAWRPLGWALKRWAWLRRLDERIETRQIAKRETRPDALPVVPMIVDVLWGWTAGGSSRNLDGPRDAPRRWAFANGARFQFPDVPQQPSYPWGDDPETDSRPGR